MTEKLELLERLHALQKARSELLKEVRLTVYSRAVMTDRDIVDSELRAAMMEVERQIGKDIYRQHKGEADDKTDGDTPEA